MENNNLFFIESLGALYADVQSSGIFADSKFFWWTVRQNTRQLKLL